MDNIPAYIRRKHGEEKVTYLHPLLEPYLERTYGVFVYQEDIMSASTALAGFTGPEADMLGLRHPQEEGRADARRCARSSCARRPSGASGPQVIDAVFAAFQPFERYGFNKAHATCYGLIAYQTAYLKANYTVDYMTSVLTAFRDNEEKVAAAVAECRRLGIEVRPPDVHRSFVEFTVEDDAIRFGLLAVKNVGEGAIESIIAAREEGGEFRSLADFCARVDLRLANKRVLESLVKVGALSRVRARGPAARRPWTTPWPPARPPSATGPAARRPCSTWARRRRHWSGRCRRSRRRSRASGCAGRRSCSGCTCPSIRSARGGADRAVRDRLLGRSQGRVARRAAGRDGRRSSRGCGRSSRGTRRRWPSPRSRTCRGRWRSSSSRGCTPAAGGTFAEGAILLVAGRVDHRGEEASLLADAVWVWEDAAARGPAAIAQEVARRGPRERAAAGAGRVAAAATESGNGNGTGLPPTAAGPARAGRGPATPRPRRPRRTAWPPARAEDPRLAAAGWGSDGWHGSARVDSGARSGHGDAGRLGPPSPSTCPSSPSRPRPHPTTWPLSPRTARSRHSPTRREPSRPVPPSRPRSPLEAPDSGILHVRFTRGAETGRIVMAMEELRAMLKERPGATRVVFHLPGTAGATLPMEVRGGVAYDAELLAEVSRRLGEGLVRLELWTGSEPA